MDFGDSFFARDGADTGSLFSDVMGHDFSTSFTQSATTPRLYTTQTSTGYQSAVSTIPMVSQETPSRQNERYLDTHAPNPPGGRYTSTQPSTTIIDTESLRQMLAQITRSVAAMHTLESKLATWSKRVEVRLLSLEQRVQTMQAASKSTQESVQRCLDEIEGACGYLHGLQGQSGQSNSDHISTNLLENSRVQDGGFL